MQADAGLLGTVTASRVRAFGADEQGCCSLFLMPLGCTPSRWSNGEYRHTWSEKARVWLSLRGGLQDTSTGALILPLALAHHAAVPHGATKQPQFKLNPTNHPRGNQGNESRASTSSMVGPIPRSVGDSTQLHLPEASLPP